MAYTIILSFYELIILIYVLTAIFVVYHLLAYSINLQTKFAMLILFVAVSSTLLLSNIALFFSVNWKSFLSQTFF